MKRHYSFWSKICKDKQILSDIAGAKIPFVENVYIKQLEKDIPQQIHMSQKETMFVDAEIQRLLDTECITEVSAPLKNGWTSNIFLVPKKDSGYRLILNLKPLNKFIKYQKFKMDNIDSLIKMLRPSDWLSLVDMKSAYSHIQMSKSCFSFLQFRWKNRFFFFNSLPFGIANGPIFFVRVTKGIMNYLCRNFIEILFYIDDTFIKNASRDQLLRDIEKTLDTFQKCGFTINWKKLVLTPMQELIFLGFVINTIDYTISITQDKKSDILDLLDKILKHKQKKFSIRFLGKVIGKLVSIFLACPEGPLYYRNLERLKLRSLCKSRDNWNARIRIDHDSIPKLKWWRTYLSHMIVCRHLVEKPHTISMYCDVSSFGWGAVVNNTQVQGMFSEKFKKLSINSKELMAVYYGVLCHTKILQNPVVLFHSDNTTAVSTISKLGSMDKFHNVLTRKLYKHCKQNDIILKICFIFGKSNIKADFSSRHFKHHNTEWSLDKDSFQLIQRSCPFSMDINLFTSHLNCKISKYCAWKPDPFTFAINSFNLNWSLFNGFAFPPFSQILRVVKKVEEDRVRNLGVVCPWWPQSIWFPLLVKNMSSMPIFLPKDTSSKLKIPWHANLKHPLS